MKFSIFNFQFSRKETGFTLIELLIVIAVLSTVGAVVANIITISLRGANKVNVLTSARQNGDYVLSQMAKVLRYAKSLDAIGGQTVTNCIVGSVPTPSPTPVLANYDSITITLLDNTQTTFACSGNTIVQTSSMIGTPAPAPSSLIDTTSVIVVSGSCSFTCYQEYALDPPKIGIKFRLVQATQNVLFEKKITEIPFETSVTLRNVVK